MMADMSVENNIQWENSHRSNIIYEKHMILIYEHEYMFMAWTIK